MSDDLARDWAEAHANRWAEAKCIGMPTAMFFPERGDPVEPAKAVCRTCPLTEQCLAAAGGQVGIWGGTTDDERRQMRRQRRAS